MASALMTLVDGVYTTLRGNNDNDSIFWSAALDAWVVGAGGGGGGGSGTVTSVALATGATGLTVSGGTTQTITGSGTFTIAGTLATGHGGTGLSASGSAGNLLLSTGSIWASVALSGDATLSAAGALTLASVGTAATKGSATKTVTMTTDVKGRVTSLSDQDIAIPSTQVTDFDSAVNALIAASPVAATAAYDLSGATEGTYLNGQVVQRFTTVRPIFFPATFNGVFKAKTLSTGTVTVTMSAVGYGTICTAQFTSGSLTATVTPGALTGVPAGTDIIVTMPATADATLAGVYWSVFGSVIPQSALAPADLSGGSLGTYLNGEVIYRLIAVRNISLSTTSTDHIFRCITGPASAGGATVTMAIEGGATILTAAFAQNATSGVVTLSNTSIPSGSVILLTMPATADANFASLYFTVKGEA